MSSTKTIHWDEFVSTYKPIQNHLDSNASGDGCWFETYGAEHDFVRSIAEKEPNRVWTILDHNDDDDGDPEDGDYEPLPLPIVSGYHWVNRLNYIITEVPCPDDITIDVIDD
jgi:hypothetical protein